MINFSELNSHGLQTTREQIISGYSQKTGLSEETITNLFEQYNFACNGVEGLVIKKLDALFESKIEDESAILEKIKSIFKSKITPAQKTEQIYTTVDSIQSDSVFISALLLIVSIIADSAVSALYESADLLLGKNGTEDGSTSELLDIDSTYYDEYDTFTTENRIELANSLKELLSKNNKRFGYNYHLDNVYLSMLEVIQKTSEELSNQNNVQQLSSTFHDDLIKGLFLGNIQPMWRDVNYLKTVVPDLQTLVFDMMVFVTGYIIENKRYAEYINIDSFTQFRLCANNLYNALIQSKDSSRLLDKAYINQTQEEITAELEFFNVRIDPKYAAGCASLKSQNVLDAIYMINSCRSEFNLGLRPIIRQYVTKAMNIVQVLDRIKFESQKINKFKN